MALRRIHGLSELQGVLLVQHAMRSPERSQEAMQSAILAPLLLLVLPAGHLTWTVAAFLVIGLNSSANEFLPRAMMADVCDRDHVQSGSERMGLYYSLLQLSSKFASGSGIFIGFSFLTVFGFDPELGLDNSEEALDRLRYLVVALPVLAYAVIIGLLRRYPISRDSQRQMREIIEEREELAARR